MNKIKHTLSALIITCALAFSDTSEQDTNFNTADGLLAAGDLVIVRPISSAVTIGAFGIFAVISPFTEMAGCTEETYSGLVGRPGEFSFDRDLGDFKK